MIMKNAKKPTWYFIGGCFCLLGVFENLSKDGDKWNILLWAPLSILMFFVAHKKNIKYKEQIEFQKDRKRKELEEENDVIKHSPIKQSNSILSENDSNIQVSELLKQATAFKKIDIEKSILLIEQAIKIKHDYSTYDKLTSYLIIAGKYDEAETVFTKMIEECKGNDILFNFSNRAGHYGRYSDFLFKKGLYKDYVFYYCLSIYNSLVWCALSEDVVTIKAQLKYLKNKEEFIDKKTNKSFQEIGAASNQNLFIETFYKLLKDFKFEELCKLVDFLNNRQKEKEKLEIESFSNLKEDWKLWSNNEFCEAIHIYDEKYFIEKYKTKLEVLL